MSFEITYARSALKELRKLDGDIARRLLRAIDALAEDPRPAGCLQLSGGDGELRIRVGDYRVIYDVVTVNFSSSCCASLTGERSIAEGPRALDSRDN